MQAGPKWRFCRDFPSCSESAEIAHLDSFCVKKCPCSFFFQEGRKIWTKLHATPLPPFLSISKQCRIMAMNYSENAAYFSCSGDNQGHPFIVLQYLETRTLTCTSYTARSKILEAWKRYNNLFSCICSFYRKEQW